MDISPTMLLLLLSAFPGVTSFNIDTSQAKVLTGEDASFGQSVVQFSSKSSTWVVVSAPLQPDRRGQVGKLYRCSYDRPVCDSISIPVLPESKMSSFGLTLAASSQLLVGCGIVPKECYKFIYSRGVCYNLDKNFRINGLTKEPECPKGADIVFLIDGSGSVSEKDFFKMQDFVKAMIDAFKGHDVSFALMQYSSTFILHFDFSDFRSSRSTDSLMEGITQLRERTHTPTAIQKVVQTVFTPDKGSRPKAIKILIVITDGKTYGDQTSLSDVVAEAEKKGIVRYAIGVGNAFREKQAELELDTIASRPTDQHKFSPDNFDALSNIKETLQQKIFSIEGTQATNISSFQLEMAQRGSSAAFTQSSILLGSAGAYDWSGGLFVYPPQQGRSEPTFINVSSAESKTWGSYLGYATKVANLRGGQLYVSGAPRYQHVGRVMIFAPSGSTMQTISGTQVGSYFGAELCTLDVNGDGITDFLLVAAPMYHSEQIGGIVHVYRCDRSTVSSSSQKILQGMSGTTFSGFGSSIASLGDINGDGYADVAIGAPQENGQVGSIYIFHGERKGITSPYSQRIVGSEVSSGVRLFGRSVSGGMDVSKDNLKDIAVGARGEAFILRPRPVIRVTPSITFSPGQIPVSKFECTGAESASDFVSNARICFRTVKVTDDDLGSLQASVDFGLRLDAALKVNPRAFFESNKHYESGTVDISSSGRDTCKTYGVKLLACIEDSLTPIGLTLNFTVTGKAISGADALRPVLDIDSVTLLTAELPFQKNCGRDNRCDDKLKVFFNFSGFSVLAVGISPSIDLTVSIQNDGEDSYKTLVTFFYPAGLSYRKVTLLESTRRLLIGCDVALGSPEDTNRTTSCRINHPIFKRGSRTLFVATFDVSQDFSWGDELVIQINATSDNGDQQNPESKFTGKLQVQYGVNILLTSMDEKSVRYINFTSKAQDEKKLVRHVYQVENSGRKSLDLEVTFLIPVSLGPSQVWATHGVTPQTGRPESCKDIALTPSSTNIVPGMSERTILDCSVVACRKVHCEVQPLQKGAALQFVIEGNVGKTWIPQGPQRKFSLVSSAEITFDRSKYQPSNSFLEAKMTTLIEVYDEYNYLPIILGSSLGGLALLALISAGLYKAGFFSRRYKRMMEDSSNPGSSEMPVVPATGLSLKASSE